MIILLLVCVYLMIHLAIIRIFQRGNSGRAERSILLLHVASFFVLLTLLSTTLILRFPSATLSGATAALFLHAVYSLSYLELWALSEGSLSLRILADVAMTAPRPRAEVIAAHVLLVDSKKTQRMTTLIALGIVRKDESAYCLTSAGQLLSGLLGALGASAGFHKGG